MGSYVNENLLPSESVVYQASLSLWAHFWRILLGIILMVAPIAAIPWVQSQHFGGSQNVVFGILLIPVLFGFITLAGLWVKFTSTELAVTNRRVIAKFGVVSRETFELNIDRVEGIQVSQDVTGRIFNYGTLRIGGTGNADPIPNISHPLAFKKAVMESQDLYRESFRR